MAIELAADDITANAVAPGPTETDSFRANSPKGSEGEARYLARVPMGRLALTHEVAASNRLSCCGHGELRYRSDAIRRWWRKHRDSLGRG
jgi:NAD(P)-dependent dehydrogenase (short-subunit alcohol dehydrogenase family)